ncbi:FMN-dependent NADH-azoreductase [Salipaludibacillus keqinensis]|uniref:FMN dependent NADH:quinone oxidoreductase n=1 Tax=Salipaludibacillus keqinensis TaxID=2045207 RepID=A0A323TAV7_9BACI|nr:NAD(P)H-dependent oxidoreductase [Salipaludibacillus keqinensis]PYZ91664.1 FMN-dependent NADH-azoreductase [Salipaludibacillus keqinensis]
MTLLYVTANPKHTKESYGLQLAEYFMEEYLKQKPDENVERLDLFEVDLPPLGREALAMWERNGSNTADTMIPSNPFVEQFLKAERIVIVTPLWNMSFPPQVKAYVDHLIIPEKTFRFTDKGIEGLMQNKKMIHIQSRGGVYSEGPLQAFEHGESYLRTIFGLIGLKDYHHLYIEGTSTFPDEVEERLEKAKEQAKSFVRVFTEPAHFD